MKTNLLLLFILLFLGRASLQPLQAQSEMEEASPLMMFWRGSKEKNESRTSSPDRQRNREFSSSSEAQARGGAASVHEEESAQVTRELAEQAQALKKKEMDFQKSHEEFRECLNEIAKGTTSELALKQLLKRTEFLREVQSAREANNELLAHYWNSALEEYKNGMRHSSKYSEKLLEAFVKQAEYLTKLERAKTINDDGLVEMYSQVLKKYDEVVKSWQDARSARSTGFRDCETDQEIADRHATLVNGTGELLVQYAESVASLKEAQLAKDENAIGYWTELVSQFPEAIEKSSKAEHENRDGYGRSYYIAGFAVNEMGARVKRVRHLLQLNKANELQAEKAASLSQEAVLRMEAAVDFYVQAGEQEKTDKWVDGPPWSYAQKALPFEKEADEIASKAEEELIKYEKESIDPHRREVAYAVQTFSRASQEAQDFMSDPQLYKKVDVSLDRAVEFFARSNHSNNFADAFLNAVNMISYIDGAARKFANLVIRDDSPTSSEFDDWYSDKRGKNRRDPEASSRCEETGNFGDVITDTRIKKNQDIALQLRDHAMTLAEFGSKTVWKKETKLLKETAEKISELMNFIQKFYEDHELNGGLIHLHNKAFEAERGVASAYDDSIAGELLTRRNCEERRVIYHSEKWLTQNNAWVSTYNKAQDAEMAWNRVLSKITTLLSQRINDPKNNERLLQEQNEAREKVEAYGKQKAIADTKIKFIKVKAWLLKASEYGGSQAAKIFKNDTELEAAISSLSTKFHQHQLPLIAEAVALLGSASSHEENRTKELAARLLAEYSHSPWKEEVESIVELIKEK